MTFMQQEAEGDEEEEPVPPAEGPKHQSNWSKILGDFKVQADKEQKRAAVIIRKMEQEEQLDSRCHTQKGGSSRTAQNLQIPRPPVEGQSLNSTMEDQCRGS